MKPLDATEIANIDAATTRAERIWALIPLLGWAIAGSLWDKRTHPIVVSIESQLKERQGPESRVWGEDASRREVALIVCRVASKELGWPNDHFIPEDPAAVVFWAHKDGLDVESAVMHLEDELGIRIGDAEVENWFHLSLDEVVQFLWARRQVVVEARLHEGTTDEIEEVEHGPGHLHDHDHDHNGHEHGHEG